MRSQWYFSWILLKQPLDDQAAWSNVWRKSIWSNIWPFRSCFDAWLKRWLCLIKFLIDSSSSRDVWPSRNNLIKHCVRQSPVTMEGGHEERATVTDLEFTSLLIELHRGHPELWKVKNRDYFNRNKKNAALIQIKNALRKIKTYITVKEIKKKINSLRTCFNREFRLIETKKKLGAAADDIPECSLWYYNDLFFIKDQIEISHLLWKSSRNTSQHTGLVQESLYTVFWSNRLKLCLTV